MSFLFREKDRAAKLVIEMVGAKTLITDPDNPSKNTTVVFTLKECLPFLSFSPAIDLLKDFYLSWADCFNFDYFLLNFYFTDNPPKEVRGKAYF